MRKRIFWIVSLLAVLFLFNQSGFAQKGEGGVLGTMSGRVTDTNGNGVGMVLITAQQPPNFCWDWTGATTFTSPFGYYSFEVHQDCTFIVFPSKKNYTFTPNLYIITFGTDGDYNFVATHN